MHDMIKRFYGQSGPQKFKPFNLKAFLHIRIPSQLLCESSDTRKRSLAATWMNGRRSVLVAAIWWSSSTARNGRFTSKWRCQCGCRMLTDLIKSGAANRLVFRGCPFERGRCGLSVVRVYYAPILFAPGARTVHLG